MKGIAVRNLKSWTCALVLLGLATLSPAPIKDKRSAEHELPQHSAAQRQAETKYNGTIGVVGSVPAKTNEDGTGVDPVAGDATAKGIVMAAPLASDPKALEALAEANRRVAAHQQDSGLPWTAILITFAVTGSAVFGARFALQKYGPAPVARGPMRGAGNNVITIEDENWK